MLSSHFMLFSNIFRITIFFGGGIYMSKFFFLIFHVFFTFYAIFKITLLFTVFSALPGDISGTISEGDRRTLQAGCHATTAGV